MLYFKHANFTGKECALCLTHKNLRITALWLLSLVSFVSTELYKVYSRDVEITVKFVFLLQCIFIAGIYWFMYEMCKSHWLQHRGSDTLQFVEAFSSGALAGSVSSSCIASG